MLFNSFRYFAFLIVVVPMFYVCPARFRWLLLLVASYLFYMCWHPAFILLIITSTLVDYLCARKMVARPQAARTPWLWLSIVVNLGLLFTFKYFNFFIENAAMVLEALGVPFTLDALEIILPVGISFYTFQTLGYSIDVYRSRVSPEPHLGRFALYVAFFPQLVAGPIERASRLLPQIRATHTFDIDRLISGLRLILWGLFKKVVIADRLAEFVNYIYRDPQAFSGSTLLLATYFFAVQIYCDFSGYTDIAIGTGRLLGFDLMRNFRLPYLATSIQDFWRRWHISLTTWFRDYVYYPLGGSRVANARLWVRNILVVFLVSGLWHGANWTFVVWGLIHAVVYFAEQRTSNVRSRLANRLALPASLRVQWGRFVTFHIVVLAWVFFRAENLAHAQTILSRIGTDLLSPVFLGPSQVTTVLSILLILMLAGVQLLQFHHRLPSGDRPVRLPTGIRWSIYIALTLGIALLGQSNNDFIYFQF